MEWESIGDECDDDGFTVDDAKGFGLSDAYDDFWYLTIDGETYVPGCSATLTGQGQCATISGDVETLSGLNVSQHYTVFWALPTLRVLVTLENPTGSSITVPVRVDGNLGSDSSTTIEATSSGDLTFDTSDRWLVTNGDPSDPVNTFAFFGPGSPAATPTAASFPSDDEIEVSFSVTVPAGATRHLLFFSQLSPTIGEAISEAAQFDTLDLSDAGGLLCGLSKTEWMNTLNWDFKEGPEKPIPTLGQWGMIFLALLMVGVAFRQVRKRMGA